MSAWYLEIVQQKERISSALSDCAIAWCCNVDIWDSWGKKHFFLFLVGCSGLWGKYSLPAPPISSAVQSQ